MGSPFRTVRRAPRALTTRQNAGSGIGGGRGGRIWRISRAVILTLWAAFLAVGNLATAVVAAWLADTVFRAGWQWIGIVCGGFAGLFILVFALRCYQLLELIDRRWRTYRLGL